MYEGHKSGHRTVSIITVSRNNRAGLEETYQSIVNQNYENWMLYVVIGDSSDGTKDFALNTIAKNRKAKVYFDKSNGIYAAMNQGLKEINFDLVWFMNSGDKFYSNNSITSAVNQLLSSNSGLLIGGYSYKENDKLKEFSRKSKSISKRDFSLNIRSACHQSMLLDLSKTSEMSYFNESYRLAADFDYYLRILEEVKCFRTSEILSVIQSNGISSTNIMSVITEKQKIRRELFRDSKFDIILGIIWSWLLRLKIFFTGSNRHNSGS
jgi:glycosyltransferase involved in cell wall biosynthesis